MNNVEHAAVPDRVQRRRLTDIPLIASKRRGNAARLALIKADNNVNVVCESWLTINHARHYRTHYSN